MLHFHIRELIAAKEVAERRKITVQEVADACGINRMTISKLLQLRESTTSTETLDKLCQYFSCPIEKLVTYVPPTSRSAADAKSGERPI